MKHLDFILIGRMTAISSLVRETHRLRPDRTGVFLIGHGDVGAGGHRQAIGGRRVLAGCDVEVAS